jgi:CAAX prenyl protease-like protein
VAIIPVAEELAFRGFLLRRVDSEDFQSVEWNSVSWIAILVSSAAFGVLHGDRWFAATIAGVLYALAYVRRGSIGECRPGALRTDCLTPGVLVRSWQFW